MERRLQRAGHAVKELVTGETDGRHARRRVYPEHS
jgi:hypothetical protein